MKYSGGERFYYNSVDGSIKALNRLYNNLQLDLISFDSWLLTIIKLPGE